jgi:FtsH-binding integral membrane protein
MHLCIIKFTNKKKLKKMGNILYLVAIVLIICWAIGFFAYSAGGIIHILLVIAAISILLRIISGDKIVK